jgi:hypothetical protein
MDAQCDVVIANTFASRPSCMRLIRKGLPLAGIIVQWKA